MQALVAVVVAVLASPVLSEAVRSMHRDRLAEEWECRYWELRRAVLRGDELPPPP